RRRRRRRRRRDPRAVAREGSAGRQPPDERGAPAQQGAQDAGRGDRGLRPGPPPGRRRYEVDREDLLDQHVGYYLRHHPEAGSPAPREAPSFPGGVRPGGRARGAEA
ncbi:unnamed protein product, partial [Prorocentrum cordatum]